jgi:predicted ATPase/transcriptional regulator with XRE-family HTH domain
LKEGTLTEVSFGEWLKRQRNSRGLTQEQLAHQIGCATITLRKIEAEERRPSAAIVDQLIKIFEIPQGEKNSFLKFARGDWTKAPGERSDETPWQSSESPRTNLPSPLTSLVGREKEQSEVIDLLGQHRLVTLTGPGGIGKTRLGIEAARQSISNFVDGVFFVEMAALGDPSPITSTTMQALGYVESGHLSTSQQLVNGIGKRQMLIVFDNCEHLIGDIALFVSRLLSACPHLKILATSRERLHINGEQEYQMRPLNLPDLADSRTIDSLENIEAIALFIKRARAVHPTFSPDDKALEDLARICIRLDGLPLAIELCAPMVKVFPLGTIVERIEKSLDAIPRGPRDLPARQQTLRDTIQWSFDLLDENEKRLFIRLSIFNGGGTLQAIEKICGEGITVNVEHILSELVNKNLVFAREREDREIHFELLETIRQYGREKLSASGEAEGIAERHADYFMNLAKQGAVELRGPEQFIWTDRFITMHNNMRVALNWIVEQGESEVALQFANVLFEFWLRHSDYEEAQQWYNRLLALPDAQQHPETYLEGFNHFTWVYWLQTNLKEARTFAEQALILSRSQTSKVNTVGAFLNMGLLLISERRPDQARDYLEKAKDICREYQYEWELARAHLLLGIASKYQKQYTSARSHFSEAFNLFRQLGDTGFQCVIQRSSGDLEIEQGNLNEATHEYNQALLGARKMENRWLAANIIWGLARVAKAKEHHDRSFRLYLVSKKIFDDIGAWWSSDDLEFEGALAAARARLGDAEFQSALDDGRYVTMEEGIAYALEEPPV